MNWKVRPRDRGLFKALYRHLHKSTGNISVSFVISLIPKPVFPQFIWRLFLGRMGYRAVNGAILMNNELKTFRCGRGIFYGTTIAFTLMGRGQDVGAYTNWITLSYTHFRAGGGGGTCPTRSVCLLLFPRRHVHTQKFMRYGAYV